MKSPSEQSNITDKALLKTLLLSLFSILFAMVCLAGLTYAWFSAHVSGGVTTMTAANFGVEKVEIADPASGGSSEAQGDGTYLLTATAAGAEFTVTITPSGEATQGYFSLQFSAEGMSSLSFCTAPVEHGKEFSFTITFTEVPMPTDGVSLTLSVRAAWGTASGTETLGNNATLTFNGTAVVVNAAP